MNDKSIISAFKANKEKNFIIYTRQVHMDGFHPVFREYAGDYMWNEYDRTIAEPIPCYEKTRVLEIGEGFLSLEHTISGRDDRGSIVETIYLAAEDVTAISFFEEEKVVLEGVYPALVIMDE